ncbi:uncharacterized protein DFL_001632 [Arthrobotrys flagrans]|uniref:Uncharacterized protein n=1 Tax=Arthrobotrys flagrans TaxID=97331 RepID=A0A437A8F8_ARTFL|nr:hypothetical protein DFL_001632 [Arthrobotrys flagrans]
MNSDASDRIEQVPVNLNTLPTASQITFLSSRWNATIVLCYVRSEYIPFGGVRDQFDAILSRSFYEVTICDMEVLVAPRSRHRPWRSNAGTTTPQMQHDCADASADRLCETSLFTVSIISQDGDKSTIATVVRARVELKLPNSLDIIERNGPPAASVLCSSYAPEQAKYLGDFDFQRSFHFAS